MRDEPRRLGDVVRWIVRHPWEAIGRRWNYKSAVLSALVRSTVFFTTNLTAGAEAAAAAMAVEFALRFATAGFYGAMTQALRQIEPARTGLLVAVVVLPVTAHTLEWVVHSAAATPRLRESIIASMLFTVLSTAFNLFAMRRGALIVGQGSRSLASDLAALPRIGAAFIVAAARSCLGGAPAR